jgi:hypothetical protein
MEQISKCILQQPQSFDAGFITKVITLADRLKFYDPVMEKSYEDNFNNNEPIEDPKWLQDLSMMLHNGAENTMSQQYEPQQPTAVPTYSVNDVYNPQSEYQQPPAAIYDPMGSQHQTPMHAAAPAVMNQTYEEQDSHQYSFDQQNHTINNQMPIENYNQDQSFSNQQQYQTEQVPQSNIGTIQNENINQNMVHGNYQTQQNYMQPSYDQIYQQQQQQQPSYDQTYQWDQVSCDKVKKSQSFNDLFCSPNRQ